MLIVHYCESLVCFERADPEARTQFCNIFTHNHMCNYGVLSKKNNTFFASRFLLIWLKTPNIKYREIPKCVQLLTIITIKVRARKDENLNKN